ncbi:MuF-like minor capsid protein [Microbacterium phage FuzzBuster]|uniref:MuF-like minor capsid protein n=1 Tax=Microbacterium phage FuzzBuster TaxID=2590935 RepID=A0A516KUZ6_9CAUD|nr:MuF-like minor capsid protein [Microbacterium phage FuzzBuster]
MMAFPSLEYTRDQLESPGAAVARQVRLEGAVNRVLDKLVRDFLASIRRDARDSGLQLSAGLTWATWELHSAKALAEMPSTIAAWLAPELAASEIPDIAYDSVRLVLTMAVDQGWSAAQTDDQIRLALEPDAGPTELVAAASRRGPRHGARWDELDAGGMSFMDRMKRDARTAVTGLDGMITVNALGEQGFTRKRWVTRHDDKVRETHRHADGDTVALSEPFYVGGYPLMYPGQRGAPPEIVINCRCVIVGTRWRATGPISSGRIR